MKKILIFSILIFCFKSTAFSCEYQHDFFIKYNDGVYYLISDKETSSALPNEVFNMKSGLDGVIYKDRATLNIDAFRIWFGQTYKGYYCCRVINHQRSKVFYKVNDSLRLRVFTSSFTVIYKNVTKNASEKN